MLTLKEEADRPRLEVHASMMKPRHFVSLCALVLLCCAERDALTLEREADEREFAEEVARNFETLKKTKACEGCWLSGTQWPAAQLRGAKLRDANFHDGDYRDADLRDADLRDAALGADLTNADLRGAKVELVSFSGAILKGTRMDALDLRTVRFAHSTDWSGAILRGADLRGVRFRGATGLVNHTKPSSVMHTGIGGTRLVGTDLRDADLRDAVFTRCDLINADLRGAYLPSIDLDGANLTGADLTGAKLSETRVCGPGSIGRCIPVTLESAPPTAQPRRKLRH